LKATRRFVAGLGFAWGPARPRSTPRRGPGSEGSEGSAGGKSPEGKPHERYRHEIGPEGFRGRKPTRGCETLKSEGVG